MESDPLRLPPALCAKWGNAITRHLDTTIGDYCTSNRGHAGCADVRILRNIGDRFQPIVNLSELRDTPTVELGEILAAALNRAFLHGYIACAREALARVAPEVQDTPAGEDKRHG